jgi:hypothetical protein
MPAVTLSPARVEELEALHGPEWCIPVSDTNPPTTGPGRHGTPHPRGLTADEAEAIEERWASMPGSAAWIDALWSFRTVVAP